MTHYLLVYQAQLKKAMAIWLQYRVAMLIWLLGMVVQPVVYLVVWITVARAQGGTVGTYDVSGFAAYYIVLMYVDLLTFTWIMWEYDWRVREGEISKDLLLPIHPIHADIADNIIYKLFGLMILIPVGVGLALAFNPVFNFETWALIAFIPSLIMAFISRFMLGYLTALAAFWTTRIVAINRTYFVLQLFFSGRFTPLELLPASVQWLANALPFKWFLAFPVELLLGRVSPTDAQTGLLIQAAWTVISVLLVRAVWQRAVRKYSAFGS